MSIKFLIVSLIIILITVAAVILAVKPKVNVLPEEKYLVEDQLLVALTEEFDNVSAEQTIFNEAVENDIIANDISMFYWE